MDPEIKGILMDTFETGRKLSETPYQPYTNATVAPMSPFQQEGMQATVDAARYGVGQDEMRDAINTTRDLTGYQPYQVNAGRVTAPNAYQPTAITTGTITESTVDPTEITAAQIKDQDMRQYMNPYTTQAIDAAMGDIERQRLIQQDANDAQAVAGGAFGGDRHAILGAETNRAAIDRMGNIASQMRNTGFDRAAALAQSDVQRLMEARGRNQQTDLQGQLANQRAGIDADKATAELKLRGDTETGRQNLTSGLAYNAAVLDAATSNQDADLAAALANQNAGLDSARLRLGAGNQLGNLGQDKRDMTYGDAAAITGVGNVQQDFSQEILDDLYARYQMEQMYPFQMFDVLRSGAGMLPNPTLTSSRSRDRRIGFPTS